MKKIAFTTLGCKVNVYDTEAMLELFAKKGYEIVDFDDFADIYVINTCTVTNFGDKKSRQSIRRAKRQNPNAVVVATGCYAQVAPDQVEKIQGINIVIGTKNRSEIVEIVEKYTPQQGVVNVVSNIMKEKEFEPLAISKLKGRTRAYLKIQEGCNRFCSYCIIPYARGPIRSRNPQEVIDEVKLLAENGFKEVVLSGIHVASYGIDKGTSLIEIVKQVSKISGIERIRFSSMEPNYVTDEFVREMKAIPKVCDHFHLSLQSGCDKTLKNMNRRYNTQEYAQAVDRLRQAYPQVAITTDIIVGFPGESEEDFIESCNFAKKVKLAKIHSFPYSPKKGTVAEKMPNQLPNEVKAERSNAMIEVSNQLNREFLNQMLDKTVPVLFEREIDTNLYEGHTTNYIRVVAQSRENIKNCILNVHLSQILKEETIKGEIL